MQGTPRLKPWRVRQLYQCIRRGIFDEDKLMHIGWSLYTRGEAVLMFGQALRGQVPCPQCDQIVYRRNFYRERPSAQPSASQFSCPICGEKVTWHDCRDALRNHPRCFDCRKILAWNYSTNTLTCSSCKQIWTWQKYRQSIKHRVRLPCPHCNNILRKPPSSKLGSSNRRKVSSHWDLTCPNCKRQGQHESAMFCCTHCGYTKKWRAFTKQQKTQDRTLKLRGMWSRLHMAIVEKTIRQICTHGKSRAYSPICEPLAPVQNPRRTTHRH